MNLIQRIAAGTGLTVIDVDHIARNAPRRYKVYEIPKRNSTETRTIAQPAKEVKSIQRWLVRAELADLPVHQCATAYTKGSSIRENAERHAKNSFLLKMDFRDFFPSLSPGDLVEHLSAYSAQNYSESEIDLLCRLLFWAPKGSRTYRLSIGAPSSPFISNSLMVKFDESISQQCAPDKVVYTRYADDLAFSTCERNRLDKVHAAVLQVASNLEYPKNLAINPQKTVFTSSKHRKFVTGLVLNALGDVSLGRARKREIRAGIHHFREGLLSDDLVNRLSGHIAFAQDVEPEFVERMAKKYGRDLINQLLRRN